MRIQALMFAAVLGLALAGCGSSGAPNDSAPIVDPTTPTPAPATDPVTGGGTGNTVPGPGILTKAIWQFGGQFESELVVITGMNGVASDKFGNVYVTGTNGGGILFITKLDASSKLIWFRQFETGGAGRSGKGYAITVDDAGYVYVTGHAWAELVPAGVSVPYAGTGNGKRVFVAKYTSDGIPVWIRQFGGGQNEGGTDIAVDVLGNVVIAGMVESDIDGTGPAIWDGISIDCFVANLDSNGNMQWGRQYRCAYKEPFYMPSVAQDAHGNVYMKMEIQYDFASMTPNVRVADHPVVIAFDANGMKRWARQEMEMHVSGGVRLDRYGNVYIAGLAPSGLVRTTKVSPQGRRLWLQEHTLPSDYLPREIVAGMRVTPDGDVYVAGSTRVDMDGAGPGQLTGQDNLFVLKVDRNGYETSLEQISGPSNSPRYSRTQVANIGLDPAGNVYVIGLTEQNLDGNHPLIGAAYGFDNVIIRLPAQPTVPNPPPTPGPDVAQIGSDKHDQGNGIATRSDGTVLIVGTSTGAVQGWGNAAYPPPGAGDQGDVFVAALDPKNSNTPSAVFEFGTPLGDAGHAIAVASNKNVFVAGNTSGNLAKACTDANNGCAPDAFVTMIDKDLTARNWTTQFGSVGDDKAFAIATDDAGGVYVAGYTRGDLDGVAHLPIGDADAFIAKFNLSGQQLWLRQLGTRGDDLAYGLAVDAAGNIYLTGETGGGIASTGNAGGKDIFVAKYDTAGVLKWTRQFGTGGDDIGRAITSDGGNVLVTGSTGGDLDGSGPGAYTGMGDGFVLTLDGDGTVTRTRQFGSSQDDTGYGIALDSSGAVFVTGLTYGNLAGPTSGVGSGDLLVTKFGADGALQWIKQKGTPSFDTGYAIAADAFGNVYATGASFADFDATGPGQYQGGLDDAIIVRYAGAP